MHIIERIVSHSHAGKNGKLKLPAAMDFMMDCCQMQERTESDLTNYMRANNMAIFLASIQLDVIRQPMLGEKMKIKVVIYDCKNIYGFRQITIADENQQVCLIANAIGAFFSFTAMRAVKLPEEIVASLTLDPAEAMKCLPRKIPVPTSDFTMLEPARVRPSRMDVNGHLTSSEYLAIAEDRLPPDFAYNRMRIEYKLQATEGALIQPKMYELSNGNIVIDIVNAANHPHAIVEFSNI